MAKPGPKEKTREHKRAAGTLKTCRDAAVVVEFPKVEKHPDPPEWMDNVDAKQQWNKLVPLLMNAKTLTIADLEALAHLCRLHGEVIRDYRRDISPKAATLTQLRLYFETFGLTPASRQRVSPVGDGGKENPFKKNGPQKGK